VVRADGEAASPGRDEGDLLEACVREPQPDVPRQVGFATVPRPDGGRAGRAEHGQRSNRLLHVGATDVAEDSAREQQVCRCGSRVGRSDPCVRGQHLQAVQSRLLYRCSRRRHVRRFQLDERSHHVVAPVVLAQRSDDVVRLTGTHAQEPKRPLGVFVSALSDECLDDS
jgi:hypothetical protein